MTSEPIRDEEFSKIMQRAFQKIFAVPYYANPAIPFVSGVQSRELLYPVWGSLDDELYSALRKAALFVGDEKFYLSLLDKFIGDTDWIISFDDNYYYFRIAAENPVIYKAHYSTEGKWGILVNDDLSAVVGGSEEFTRVLFENLPPNKKEESLDAFLQDYKLDEEQSDVPDYSYLEAFLIHMYGDEQATFLMDKYSLKY